MINPTHPGESVLNCIEESSWTVAECAERIGASRDDLTNLVNGEARISPQIAMGLESIGWSNADFWLRLQANYDLAQERLRRVDRSPVAVVVP